MQICHNALVILFLASTVGQAIYIKEVTAHQTEPVQTRIAQGQTRVVSAVLPPLTEVMLKNTGSKFGKLTTLDPKNQQLTLLLQNGESELIATAQIAKVLFRREDPTVSREDLGPPQGEKRKWPNIPQENLKIQANGNRVEVRLPCEVDPTACKEKGASYTIQELSFATKNKLTLVVLVAK
jgi:hypothetical protein